ncbi:MAG: hypothetical protein WA125_17980, partial [Desulfosporosinus sp.]
TNTTYEEKGVQLVNHVTKAFFTQSLKFISFWIAIGGLIFLVGHFILIAYQALRKAGVFRNL